MKKLFLLWIFPFLLIAAEPTSSLTNESELGAVLTSGNSSTKTLQAKHTSKYTLDANNFTLQGKYLYGKASDVESARSWSAGLKYGRDFSERFGIFLGNSWEGDTFNGYEYRTNVDAGGKYYLFPEEKDKKGSYLFTEAGYRYTYEARVDSVIPRTANLHFIRVYLEGSKQLTGTVLGKLWVEALPSLNDSNASQFNFEGSLAVAMSEKLSLKTAYLGKYRNTPLKVGGEKYDSTFTTSLIAKF